MKAKHLFILVFPFVIYTILLFRLFVQQKAIEYILVMFNTISFFMLGYKFNKIFGG